MTIWLLCQIKSGWCSKHSATQGYVTHLNAAIAAGDRSKAVELFMTEALCIPGEYLAPMKADPSWEDMEKLAHTLAYDGEIIKDVANGKPVVAKQWQHVTYPTILIVD